MWWFPFKIQNASRHQGGGGVSHKLTCWSTDENTDIVSTLTRIIVVGHLPTPPAEEQRLLLALRSLRGSENQRLAEVDVSIAGTTCFGKAPINRRAGGAAEPERAKRSGQSGADPAPFGDPFVVVSAPTWDV
jgi:hypothetical protein